MDYNFSNNKKSGLSALQDLKQEYQKQEMSEEQKEFMRSLINEIWSEEV